jgi:protein-L-isoaspartate(D-aspartate) O-methyltransferase
LVDRVAREVHDKRVLDALRRVPRHAFVPRADLAQAYGDHPLPIGHGQTISQPTLVGIMTAALDLRGNERILEIGTGCGYQTAVLSLLAREVFSMEVVPELAERAQAMLLDLGCANVKVKVGDGFEGWPQHAPFDRVILTAAPAELPAKLVAQLRDGGMLLAPVGPQGANQRLLRLRKRGMDVAVEDLGGVVFVPMVKKTWLS